MTRVRFVVVALATALCCANGLAKVSGDDSRRDAQGRTRPEVQLTAAEDLQFNGIGVLLCESTGDAGTVTLVRKDDSYIFIGAAHVVIPDADSKVYSPAEMKARFPTYAAACDVVLTDRTGTEVLRFKLDKTRTHVGSYRPLKERSGDFIVFSAYPIDKIGNRVTVNPWIILNVTPLTIDADYKAPRYGRIIAFHHDLEVQTARIKTVGVVREYPPQSRYYQVAAGVVGHNIDTVGACSGALILNRSNHGYAIHFGGMIDAGRDADWITYANWAIDIDERIVRIVETI